ncbi:MAG: hypothetical protein HN353_08050 [Bdellovibrionales bacterium]|jgi:membrane glycosyltransferase|nr:hypothetical protein [Bdellovibrionales bacterium]MBT3525872.1 hypothetical protein [Bdellovibrionales bacterium]MBT7668398.1 hypothetical protein [Bdellovibrionales bacterium]MBT7766113.1 hypothetical protein [Bdellovibrionales bacterium]
MRVIIELFLFHFIHPYQGGSDYLYHQKGVRTSEALAISWALLMVQTAYYLAGVSLGISLSDHFNINEGLQVPYKVFQLALLFALLKTIFYPIWGWITVQFWSAIIKFFARLYDKDRTIQLDEHSQFIATSSLVSNTFLLVPILGPPVQTIASFFYIFAGVKKVLHFTTLQGVIVILSPVILMASMLLMLILNLALTLSVLMA